MPLRLRLRIPRPLAWFLLGVCAVFFARWVVNATPYADRLVSGLILPDTTGHADAIVVLGAGVTGSCTPNEFSLRRIVLATRLYRAQRAQRILITGGTTEPGGCPVASVMARTARDLGVPESAIVSETQSTSTWTNARNSAPILHALGAKRLLLVTDRLHMMRSQLCFKRFGFDIERATIPLFEASGKNVTMLYWAFRETMALRAYRWRGYIGDDPTAGPSAVAVPDEENGSVTVKNPDGPVVILGASYARGWKLAAIAGVPVVNAGVAGQQSTELLQRFEQDVVQHAPRAVVIWGFINDVFRSPRDQVPQALARARANIERMVALARTAGIEPVLATEVTIRHPDTIKENVATWIGGILGKKGYPDFINEQVLATNEQIRELARRERILLLDIQPILSDASGRRVKAFAAPDGSHITEAGYDALTAYTLPTLEAHFRKKTS